MQCAIFKPAVVAVVFLPWHFLLQRRGSGNASRNLDAIYCISFYQSNNFLISHVDKDLALTASAC